MSEQSFEDIFEQFFKRQLMLITNAKKELMEKYSYKESKEAMIELQKLERIILRGLHTHHLYKIRIASLKKYGKLGVKLG